MDAVILQALFIFNFLAASTLELKQYIFESFIAIVI